MNPVLDEIALRYAGKLFPDFLYIIENTHDFNYVKCNENAFNDKLIYDYIINDYILLNLNKEQTEYIFNIIEKKYSNFLQKQWYEFNSITSMFYKLDNKTILPDDLRFLNDKNYIEQISNYIGSNKLKLIDNYKKVKEYIFITRLKEAHPLNDIFNNIFNNILKPKEYTNEEINEYLQKWVDLSVTVDEWLNHKKINLDEELDLWELEDDKIQDIMQHKYDLFNVLKKRIVDNRLIEPFTKIFPLEDKIITAKRDLDLIENLIEGNIDEIKETRLKETLQIKNWKTTALHFDYIFRHKYKNEANYDIHDSDSFLDAHVILDYKSFLNDYLQKNENEINTTAHINYNTKNTTYKISNTNIKQKSFKYSNNDSTRLTDLLNALIKDNFIDKETELKQFRKIFSGNDIDKQIIWTGNISELSYFIKSIHNIHKKIDDTKQQLWKITYQCFIQSDGNPFDKSKFRGQKTPANKSIIDNIVKIL